MSFSTAKIPYRQTGLFSNIILDYIDQAPAIKPFFLHPPTLKGIQKAIEERKKYTGCREILVQELKKQYAEIVPGERVQKNIDSLLSPETFTITTAHQNNIFTGPLYFIYKILHVIKISDLLNQTFTDKKFVPVFYMGTEDGDLEELNHITIGTEKLTWHTKQTGAVGRMIIDKEMIKVIDQMAGQLTVLPEGIEIIGLIRKFYKEGITLQAATFHFVSHLFQDYGLVVLLPDNQALKKQMIAVFKDDLLNQTAVDIVQSTIEQLEQAGYKIQAHPREINLFYLKDNTRERIVFNAGRFSILNTAITFTTEELLKELEQHPERFSPNVILRGLYQEMILPNLAFIGGGGETAYWLQLKDLFKHYKVPFPMLVLRNSFLIIEKKWAEKISRIGFQAEDFFLTENDLINKLVKRDTKKEIKLNGTYSEADHFFESVKSKAGDIDQTLVRHVDALKAQSLKKLKELEKKMLKAEKRNFNDQARQIHSVKEHLFPRNGLQERIENISWYYAKWGKDFIRQLYTFSLNLEQEFLIVTES